VLAGQMHWNTAISDVLFGQIQWNTDSLTELSRLKRNFEAHFETMTMIE